MRARYSYSLQSSPKSRPTGVTIIAILVIIRGAVVLVGGILAILAGAFISSLPPSTFEDALSNGNLTVTDNNNGNMTISGIPPSFVPPAFIGSIATAIGGVLIAIAVASFIIGYGLLKGKRWAWTAAVVVTIISIIIDVLSIVSVVNAVGGIISIIINGVILYYLYRPHVKAYFGKGVSPSTSTI
jgi:Predicted membrane protein (DUF2127)